MIFNKKSKVSTISRGYTGFTLAEVIITIGIIGIVAAITIPILINNIQDAQYKSAYKKAYSMLSQAMGLANADNEFVDAPSLNPSPNGFQQNFLTLMSKFKVVKSCINNNNSECWDSAGEKYGLGFSSGYPVSNCYAFIDSSGTAWSQYYWGSSTIFADTNGFKKPNQWGKDRFVFNIVDKNGNEEGSMGVPVKIVVSDDNTGNICNSNKCGTVGSIDYKKYYGKSWLYN